MANIGEPIGRKPEAAQFDCTRGTITLRCKRKGDLTLTGCERGLLARLKHLFHMNVRFETSNLGTVYLSKKTAINMILKSDALKQFTEIPSCSPNLFVTKRNRNSCVRGRGNTHRRSP